MYRKGVSALIINNKKEILLVNLMTFEHHFFAIPGGGVEEAETAEEAVIREIEEELGIAPDKLEIIGKSKHPIRFLFKSGPRIRNGIKYVGQERQFFALNFTGSDEDINLSPQEVRKYVWSTFANLEKYLLFENQLEETTEMIRELCGFIIE